ncbi:tripartite motif-containing protein 2-like [Saccostrea echinata]|uniref:tripartite motif-containing protein 2-like n=1 Tax=Saccostrea echinata TaxID=191078 RepID=UPI002A814582|nr:tripartite motif-containing protein 2-like [Saccostrea echinata]
MDSMTKSLKEDYLTCVICFELFKEPKVLSCLHNFCEACLEALIQKSLEKNDLICPICRETTSLTSKSVSGLKTNFIFKDMINKLSPSKESHPKRICSFCILHSKEVEATHKCVTCMDLLCSFCTRHRHNFTRQNAYHNVVHLRDYLAGKCKAETKYEIPCEKHHERMRFYCRQCSVPICRECAVVEHRSHNYVSFAEAREIVKEEMEKNLQTCRTKKEKLQQMHSALTSKSEELSANESSLIDLVDVTCKEMESKLKQHRQKVVEEIKRKSSEKKKNIEIYAQDYLNMQERLQESISFCENLLSNGSDLEVLFFLNEMRSCLIKYPDPEEKRMHISLPSLKVNRKTEYFVFQLEDDVVDREHSATARNDTETSSALNINITSLLESQDSEGACPENPGEKPKISASVSGKPSNESDGTNAENPHTKTQKNKTAVQSETAHVPKCLNTFEALVTYGEKSPSYTCITWIDKTSFALADENNQAAVIVTTNGEGIQIRTHSVKGIAAITKFGSFLAFKTQSGEVKIFSYPNLILETVFKGAYALTSRSAELIWITKEKIIKFNDVKIDERKITDEDGNPFRFTRPLHVCCLSNKTCAVTDKVADCLFFLNRNGQISRRHLFTGKLGALSCDKENRLYMAFYETDSICIINVNGECLRTISLTCILRRPRGISVLSEEEILVSSKENVVLISLK